MPTRREARTSVLPEGQNLGAGGIYFRRAFQIKRVPKLIAYPGGHKPPLRINCIPFWPQRRFPPLRRYKRKESEPL